MKSKLLLVLATAVALVAADPYYFPVGKPIPLEWDHQRNLSSPATYYKLYLGTNLVSTLTTNQFLVTVEGQGLTNNWTMRADVVFSEALILGTNRLTITAVDPKFDPVIESDPNTNIVVAQVLGKSLPPQGPRKL